MLAAGPAAVPLISEAMEAGWQGDQRRRRLRRAARRRPTSTCARRRSTADRTKCSATSSRKPCSASMTHGLRLQRRPGNAARHGAQVGRARATTSSAGARSSRPAASRARPGRRLADLGLAGLQVPEAQGGLGFGPVDAMVVMEELGRGLVLEPYAAVALVATSLLKAGHAPSAALWLQRIAEGKELVVLAHEERRSRYRLAHVETTAPTQRRSLAAERHARSSCLPAAHAGRVHRLGARQRRRRRRGRHRACSSSRRASPASRCAAYPTQDGASGADLVLKDAARDRAGRSPARPSRRSSARSTSASPRSAPRRSARWTSWSRSRSST